MKQSMMILAALVTAVTVNASNVDGNAVLGSMVGAGVGSAVGSAVGGREGAIIGGGAGGALGAAAGSSKTTTVQRTNATSTTVVREKVIYVDEDRYHDNGKHKGQYKHHKKHGHDRD